MSGLFQDKKLKINFKKGLLGSVILILVIVSGIFLFKTADTIYQEKHAWHSFEENLSVIGYKHNGKTIEELQQQDGGWRPTTEDFKDIYKYVYGSDLVAWQTADGTDMCPKREDGKGREPCIEQWEQEWNNNVELGQINGDILKVLRDDTPFGIVNHDAVDDRAGIVLKLSQKKKLFSFLTYWIKQAIAAVEFYDSFTDTADTLVKNHTPSIGTGWTDMLTVGASSDLAISANNEVSAGLAATTCGADEGELLTEDDVLSGNNYEVSILQVDGDTADDVNILACRVQDANNMYVARFNESVTQLWKKVGGSWSQLGSNGGAVADGSTVTLICNNSTISLEDDGVEILSETDSTFSATNYAGFGMGAIVVATDDCSGQKLDTFSVNVTGSSNSTPTVSSVTDVPDPINTGATINFSVDWADNDAGEMAKVYICKTNEFATTTLACANGTWAQSEVFTNRDPEVVSYTTIEADNGNTRNYYAYVCDDEGECAGPYNSEFIGIDGWWSTSWSSRSKVVINNTTSTSELLNFPVSVQLNNSRIDYGSVQDAGQDIRFVDYDGSELNYEIEDWNESATSTLWVNVPSIEGATTTQYFYMYYGNPFASDNSTTTGVWDENYIAVHHLEETDIDGGSGDIQDSTRRANNGTTTGMNTDDDVSAKINGGFDFDGADYITVSETTDFDSTNFTYSVWINVDSSSGWRTIIDMDNDEQLLALNSGDYALYGICGNDPNGGYGTAKTDGTWHHLVWTRDGTNFVLYEDGVSIGSGSSCSGTVDASALMIASGAGGNEYFDGKIDEVRISNEARSADWVSANYETMTDDYLNFQSEEQNLQYYSFTIINSVPSAPTGLQVEGSENGVANITDITPEFSAIYNDPDLIDQAAKVCVQVNTESDFSGSDYWVQDEASCYVGTALPQAPSDWWDSTWGYRRKVTIDNTTSTSALTDFPVLVQINSSRIDYTRTKASGADIRFRNYDGTELNYEIESWNESATSTLWVKIPSIEGSTTTQYFYMYYNNLGASDNATTTGVWDENFLAVYHMDDGADTSHIYDSTSNNFNGTKEGSGTPEETIGKIGNAQDFAPTEDIQTGDTDVTTGLTISAWSKPETVALPNDIYIAWKQDSFSFDATRSWTTNSHLYLEIDGDTRIRAGNTSLTAGIWNYLVGSYDSTEKIIRLYLNGQLNSDETALSGLGSYEIETSDYNLELGSAWGSATDEDHVLDEVRVSNIKRSSDWIAAEYETMTDDYLIYGDEEGGGLVQGNRVNDQTYAGTVLSLDGAKYYWRIWFWDDEGERSATSTVGWFTTANRSAGWGVDLKGGIRLNGGIRLK